MAYSVREGIMQEYKYHWSGNGDQIIPEPIKIFPMGTETAMSEILPNFSRIFKLTIHEQEETALVTLPMSLMWLHFLYREQ